MSAYELDKDIYKAWFEEKTLTIEAMSKEQIQSRVEELSKMEFLIRREWGMLHQQYDKLTGRKGIPPWLQADRDALIKEPNYKVKFDEPREKKPKAAKTDYLTDLGIDASELKNELKNKLNKPKNKTSVVDSIVESLREAPKEVKEEPKKEITESLKERLARIRAAKQ